MGAPNLNIVLFVYIVLLRLGSVLADITSPETIVSHLAICSVSPLLLYFQPYLQEQQACLPSAFSTCSCKLGDFNCIPICSFLL
jgi:hypothetical protein